MPKNKSHRSQMVPHQLSSNKLKNIDLAHSSDEITQQKQQPTISTKQVHSKKQSSKLLPYIKAIHCLREIDLDDASPRSPFKDINSTFIWYYISVQYYLFNYIPKLQRQQMRKTIIDNVRQKIRTIYVPNRFEKRQFHKNQFQLIREFQTEQLMLKSANLMTFIGYYTVSQCSFSNKQQPLNIEYGTNFTSASQDQSFISSTKAVIFRILQHKLKTNESFYNVIKFYMQSIQLDQPSKKMKRPQRISFIQTMRQGQNLDDFNDTRVEYKKFAEEDRQYQATFTSSHVLMSVIAHIQLDFLISILEKSIPQYQFPSIDEKTNYNVNFYSNQQDTFNFIGTSPIQQEQYIAYQRQKQRDKRINNLSPDIQKPVLNLDQNQKEDHLCQICFCGDYQEDNMIVLCSLCNIAVHQNCIYLQKIPACNWICEVCEAFGPLGINLPCALCSLRGGAMKRCNIHSRDYKCGQINTSYEIYLMVKSSSDRRLERYINQAMRMQPDIPLLYNYFKQETYSKQIPICHYVWAHYNCINIISECYFKEAQGKLMGFGIETIPSQKFNKKCEICGFCWGVTLKCHEQGCNKYYHAQCARRRKVVSSHYQNNTIFFYIYCDNHKPYQLQQTLIQKRAYYRDQIRRFALRISKFVGPDKFPYKIPNREYNRRGKKVSILSNNRQKGDQRYMATVSLQQDEADLQIDDCQKQKSIEMKQSISKEAEDAELFRFVMRQIQRRFILTLNMKRVQDGYVFQEPIIEDFNELNGLFKNFDSFRRILSKSKKITESLYENFKNLVRTNSKYQKILSDYIEVRFRQRMQIQNTKRSKDGKQQDSQLLQLQQNIKMNQNRSDQQIRQLHQMSSEEKLLIEQMHGTEKTNQVDVTQNIDVQKDQQSRLLKKITHEWMSRQDFLCEAQKIEIQQNFNQQFTFQAKRQLQRDRIQPNSIKGLGDQVNNHIKTQEVQNSAQASNRINKTRSQAKHDKKTTYEKTKKQFGTRPKQPRAKQLILYCVCKQPYDQKLPMLQCQRCKEWFHLSCIGFIGGVARANLLRFMCLMCLKMQTKISYKKILSTYQGLFKRNSEIFIQYQKVSKNEIVTEKLNYKKLKGLPSQAQNRNQGDAAHSRSRAKK